jgi:hypothetical protein
MMRARLITRPFTRPTLVFLWLFREINAAANESWPLSAAASYACRLAPNV